MVSGIWDLITLSLFSAPGAVDVAAIVEDALPKVVRIQGDRSVGAGFLIDNAGTVVTNFHVIDGQTKLQVVFNDKSEGKNIAVYAADATLDLALLRVEGAPRGHLDLASPKSVRVGAPVVVIGHPLGLDSTVSDGLVSGLRRGAERELIQMSAPVSTGSSGGPVLNAKGKVIGVSTLILSEGQNLNFAVSVRELSKLYRARKAPVAWQQFVKAQIPRDRFRPTAETEGCSEAQLVDTAARIARAIDVGAPLYNEGRVDACAYIYQGALEEMVPALPSCALRAGFERALKKGKDEDHAARAWTYRHAFDAALEAVAGAHRGATAIERDVPRHSDAVLKGCDREDVVRLVKGIESAIASGAPLYNEGNAEACFRIYHGAALGLSESLRHCAGVRQALKTGVSRADGAEGWEAKAWRMRDSFDGLLDVVQRSQGR